MTKRLLITCILIILAFTCTAGAGRHNHRKVHLADDVKSVTLTAGLMTEGRRSRGVPQIKCVGGKARGKFTPEVVQCYNKGSDGIDVQWKCTTNNMPAKYRFGRTDLYCEGWGYPEDPYILAGSCGLEYTLEYATPEDENEDSWWGRRRAAVEPEPEPQHTMYPPGEWGLLKRLAFGIALFFVVSWLFGCCCGPSRGSNRNGNTSSTNATAPPPQPQPHSHSQADDPPPATANEGPGFWTGAAAGGGLGYMAGRAAAAGEAEVEQEQARPRGWFDGWFGGWGGRPRHVHHHHYGGSGSGWSWGSSGSRSSSSRSSSSGSSGRSSGFGGTRRR